MGSVVISLDGELGWGFHHLDAIPTRHIRDARRAWHRLCELFDAFDVPTTWAAVGHLFLDACDERHIDHPAGERCCTTDAPGMGVEDIWYGDDLIELVRDARVAHDIASHGFTHVHFEHERMSPAFAARELDASMDAAADRGIELTSFVHPVNRIGHRALLAEHGFGSYRGVPRADSRVPRPLRKLTRSLVGVPGPRIVEPSIDEHGLVNVPASLYLFGIEGMARSVLGAVGGDPVVRQAKAGIDRVASTDGVFHMWLHPHNVRTEADVARLRAILRHLDRRRTTDGVRVETMAEVEARIREKQ